MAFFKFVIKSIYLMSIESFCISLVGLLTIVAIANFIGKRIAQNKNKEEIMNNVNTFNIRLIRFLAQLFGIMFGLIMYWEYKDINKSSEFISSDIFLPIILLILGKLLYILLSFIGKETLIDNDERNNNRFTTLLVLTSLSVIGFIGNVYIGAAITGIILGRFFWFDTGFNDFIETVKSFKPSKDCLLAVMIPITIMILAVTLVHNNVANLYGVFWGMLTAIIISITVIVNLK